MALTSTELRATSLGTALWGKRGYARDEVDAFLDRAAAALDALAVGRAPELTADDVHHAVFRKPRFGSGRGYDEGDVDDLLDRVEQALRGAAGQAEAGAIELNGRPLDH